MKNLLTIRKENKFLKIGCTFGNNWTHTTAYVNDGTTPTAS